MILVQQLTHADGDQPVSSALAALVLAMLTLFVGIVVLVFLGAAPKVAPPALRQASLGQTPSTTALLSDSPACAAALQRAKASKILPGDQAVAANTAMLRACKRS